MCTIVGCRHFILFLILCEIIVVSIIKYTDALYVHLELIREVFSMVLYDNRRSFDSIIIEPCVPSL